jgi:hypothetical protein
MNVELQEYEPTDQQIWGEAYETFRHRVQGRSA